MDRSRVTQGKMMQTDEDAIELTEDNVIAMHSNIITTADREV